MKKTLIWTGSVIGAGAVLALLFGWMDKPDAPRTISVNGECLTTAPKDRTAITLRVTTLDKSAATSMKMATAKVNEITNYLKNQDVQMQTTEFNSYERSEWNRELEKSVVLGTETTIAIEVSADNIETIEKILTQFAGQEDVYSENLRMYTSAEAMKPILEDCLGAAVENARARKCIGGGRWSQCRQNVKRFIQCWWVICDTAAVIKLFNRVCQDGGCRCRGFFRHWQHCCQGYRSISHCVCNI